MVWWLLKKRDGRDDVHKKIDNIHNSVQGSFKNIKEDITKLNDWINHVHNHHTNNSKDINKRLLEIDRRLIKLENVILGEVEREELEEEELSIPKIKENISIIRSNILEDLTVTQKKAFLAIYQAQIQLNQAVSIKSLANLLYKDKNYNQVRSMLSDYLSILTELNLIDKKRVGRNTYVSLTPKGIEIIKKSKILKQKSKIK